MSSNMSSIGTTSSYSDAIRLVEETLPQIVNRSNQSDVVVGDTGRHEHLIKFLAERQLCDTKVHSTKPSQTSALKKWEFLKDKNGAFWDVPDFSNPPPVQAQELLFRVQELIRDIDMKKPKTS